MDSEKFNIDKKYNYLLGINKLYNNVRAKYRKTINLYLHYLFDKRNEMQANLELIIKRKRENEKKRKINDTMCKKAKRFRRFSQNKKFIITSKTKINGTGRILYSPVT